MKKVLLILFWIGIFLIMISTITTIWLKGISNKIFIQHVRRSETNEAINTIQNHFDTGSPMNIVLLGYGGGNHDGAYLTDSIIVVHIDPKTKKIFLISVPRDLWVKIPISGTDSTYAKINASYEIGLDDTMYPNKQQQFTGTDGGGRLAEYMLLQVTGLPTDYFVGMDFSGFKNTIDTLGGVDLTVEKTFDDYEYPIDGKEADLCGHQPAEIPTLDVQATTSAVETVYPCRYEHLHFDAGPQHMNGEQALSYVRSRHSMQDGTDFGRAKRQRNLLIAVKQRIFSAGFLPKIVPFISSLGDDLRTDLTPDDVKTFLQNASVLNTYQITTIALTDQNYLIDTFSSDGQSILQPKEGQDNYKSIQTYIADQISGKIEPVTPTILVENGTHTVGLATTATNQIKNMGLTTLDPQNADTANYTKTKIIVYDKNVDHIALTTLKKSLNVSTITYDATTQPTYNVLIILGTDYVPVTTTPSQ